ncbi:MAG: class I SAM-dependent methyltransferase [Fuerstiella sp.]
MSSGCSTVWASLPYDERILPQLDELAGPRRRMLDAFCGQGREAEVFARNGFEVTAIDQLPWMISAARQYAADTRFSATFLTADFHTYTTDTPFDVVYTSCWMYTTCQTSARRIAFLQQCRQLVADDGLIVMSYIAGDGDFRPAGILRLCCARLAGLLTNGNRHVEFGERIYSGLFWHHLSEKQVLRETASTELETVRVIPGEGAEPTFRILRRRMSMEDVG